MGRGASDDACSQPKSTSSSGKTQSSESRQAKARRSDLRRATHTCNERTVGEWRACSACVLVWDCCGADRLDDKSALAHYHDVKRAVTIPSVPQDPRDHLRDRSSNSSSSSSTQQQQQQQHPAVVEPGS